MSQSSESVVILGGGIIGIACAHYLVEQGYHVTIVEENTIGSGCSHGNCGAIEVNHFLPPATPQILKTLLKSGANPQSPFYIKPRFSPSLWMWLLRFLKQCRFSPMLASANALAPLLMSSLQLYRDLMSNEQLNCEWQARGLLVVFKSEQALENYQKHVIDIIRKYFNCTPKSISQSELTAFEPSLISGLAGGWFFPQVNNLRPDQLLSSWKSYLVKQGVSILEHCKVDSIVTQAKRVSALKTTHGDITGDHYVIASGALTPLLTKDLVPRLFIQPGKGYSVTVTKPQIAPTRPISLFEHSVVLSPMETRLRLGSTMEFSGYDTSLNQKRLDIIKDAANDYLQEPLETSVIEEWYGWRPMTPDGLPYIGRVPRLNNLVLAAGHNMLGMTLAPVTGKLVAEIISEEQPHLDTTAYRLNR